MPKSLVNLVEPIAQLSRSVIAPQLINHRVPPAILALKIGENIPDPHGPVAVVGLAGESVKLRSRPPDDLAGSRQAEEKIPSAIGR